MSLDQSTSLEDQLGDVRLGLTRLGRLLGSRRVHAGMAGAAGVTLPQQAMHVLRALGDRDPWTRWKAVRALGDLGAEPSRAALEAVRDDPEFRVRFEAGRVLRTE